MTRAERGSLASLLVPYLIFATLATALALIVGLAGQGVALERVGEEAAAAWRFGCGVSLVASLVAGLLVAVSGKMEVPGVTMALGSMLLRLGILGLLGSAMAMLLSLEVRAFLLAVAASYLVLLVADTGYALYVSSRAAARIQRGGDGSL
jgi:hypothetical protein